MKYTGQEQLREIRLRSKKLCQRKDRRRTGRLSLSAMVLCVLLAVCIGAFGQGGSVGSTTVYGAFLLSAEAGGYVLAAVIAFALGVIVTLRIRQYHGRD